MRLHYLEWGDPANQRVVVCAHGLTRNARDFDMLARSLAADYRVLCVDFPGRGKSDWLEDKHNYTLEYYAQACQQWLATVARGELHWIGTSMGGLVGMLLAGEMRAQLDSMIFNDVGPEVPSEALQRIAAYLDCSYRFDDLADLDFHLRLIHAPFGPLSDAEWQHLARHSCRDAGNGELMFHYDPDIARVFDNAGEQGIDLWHAWGQITAPVLLVRGELSDVLPAETAERMLAENPHCRLQVIAGVGHAPALMAEDQIQLIAAWLNNHPRK